LSANNEPSRRILVADDDPAILRLVTAIVEKEGYEVVPARDGREAYRLLQTDGEFAACVFDVVMPHMGGRRLAEHLKVSHPRTRVLYMSGYTDDAILRHGVLEETAAFMEKPFSPEVLARKVRDVLDAHA